eukprot:GHRR01032426.1.p2 GENE.GHRR01032426.1~~GHRR01032426.1.p2  ORF type:complete len:105 (-),score=35.83 GHRR01032426.1:264-578(-)
MSPGTGPSIMEVSAGSAKRIVHQGLCAAAGLINLVTLFYSCTSRQQLATWLPLFLQLKHPLACVKHSLSADIAIACSRTTLAHNTSVPQQQFVAGNNNNNGLLC